MFLPLLKNQLRTFDSCKLDLTRYVIGTENYLRDLTKCVVYTGMYLAMITYKFHCVISFHYIHCDKGLARF